MGEMRNAHIILNGKPEGKKQYGTPNTDGRMFRPYNITMRSCVLDSFGSGWGPVVSPCEDGNKPLGSKKDKRIS